MSIIRLVWFPLLIWFFAYLVLFSLLLLLLFSGQSLLVQELQMGAEEKFNLPKVKAKSTRF